MVDMTQEREERARETIETLNTEIQARSRAQYENVILQLFSLCRT